MILLKKIYLVVGVFGSVSVVLSSDLSETGLGAARPAGISGREERMSHSDYGVKQGVKMWESFSKYHPVKASPSLGLEIDRALHDFLSKMEGGVELTNIIVDVYGGLCRGDAAPLLRNISWPDALVIRERETEAWAAALSSRPIVSISVERVNFNSHKKEALFLLSVIRQLENGSLSEGFSLNVWRYDSKKKTWVVSGLKETAYEILN